MTEFFENITTAQAILVVAVIMFWDMVLEWFNNG